MDFPHSGYPSLPAGGSAGQWATSSCTQRCSKVHHPPPLTKHDLRNWPPIHHLHIQSLCVQRDYWGLSKGVKNYPWFCLRSSPSSPPTSTSSPSWPSSVDHKVQGIEKATTNVASESLLLVFRNMSKNVEAHLSAEVNLYQIRWEIHQISQAICHPPSKQKSNVIPQSARWGFLGDSNLTSFKPSDLAPQNLFWFFLPPIFLSYT